jgi:hypothetical protein
MCASLVGTEWVSAGLGENCYDRTVMSHTKLVDRLLIRTATAARPAPATQRTNRLDGTDRNDRASPYLSHAESPPPTLADPPPTGKEILTAHIARCSKATLTSRQRGLRRALAPRITGGCLPAPGGGVRTATGSASLTLRAPHEGFLCGSPMGVLCPTPLVTHRFRVQFASAFNTASVSHSPGQRGCSCLTRAFTQHRFCQQNTRPR